MVFYYEIVPSNIICIVERVVGGGGAYEMNQQIDAICFLFVVLKIKILNIVICFDL